VQWEKQDLHNTSTDAGTLMVLKLLHVNADSSIRCNFEFDSNVTDVSDVQWEKQFLVNREIDDEIHTRAANGGQRKSSVKVSRAPSRTIILQENVVTIFGVPHCEA
jgi:hypothetical protein